MSCCALPLWLWLSLSLWLALEGVALAVAVVGYAERGREGGKPRRRPKHAFVAYSFAMNPVVM